MSNTQIPITELEILRGIQRDIAGIDLHCLSSVQGFKGLCIAAITQCNRAEAEILTNPVAEAWACISAEPFIITDTNNEAEDAAMDLLEDMNALETLSLTRPLNTDEQSDYEFAAWELAHMEEAERINRAAIFDPILDMVRPPKGMSA